MRRPKGLRYRGLRYRDRGRPRRPEGLRYRGCATAIREGPPYTGRGAPSGAFSVAGRRRRARTHSRTTDGRRSSRYV